MSKDNSNIIKSDHRIYFYDSIDKKTVARLAQLIDELTKDHIKDAKDDVVEPIYLHLSSGGGELYSAIAAYHKIRFNPVPIITIADAEIASGATIMFVAGKERYIYPHATFLIHQIRCGNYSGKAIDISDYTENLKMETKILEEIYFNKSKIDLVSLRYALENEISWTAKEAVEYGFADKVITETYQYSCKNNIFSNPTKMIRVLESHNHKEEYRTKIKSNSSDGRITTVRLSNSKQKPPSPIPDKPGEDLLDLLS